MKLRLNAAAAETGGASATPPASRPVAAANNSTKTLRELAAELQTASADGILTLDAKSIGAATFRWCLGIIGVDNLMISLSSPDATVVYDEDCDTIRIRGLCRLHESWDENNISVSLSSGNTGHTVLYAHTSLRSVFARFLVPLVAKLSGGRTEASHMPQRWCHDAVLDAKSTSTTTLPNASLKFACDEQQLIEPWFVSERLGLTSHTIGFRVENTMEQNGSLERNLILKGCVTIADVKIKVILDYPVSYFSQKDIGFVKLVPPDPDTPRTVLPMGSSSAVVTTSSFGLPPLGSMFPSSLLNIPGEYFLRYYLVQLNTATGLIYQIELDIDAPNWEASSELLIQKTRFGVQLWNPFRPICSSGSANISGRSVLRNTCDDNDYLDVFSARVLRAAPFDETASSRHEDPNGVRRSGAAATVFAVEERELSKWIFSLSVPGADESCRRMDIDFQCTAGPISSLLG